MAGLYLRDMNVCGLYKCGNSAGLTVNSSVRGYIQMVEARVRVCGFVCVFSDGMVFFLWARCVFTGTKS